MKYKIAKCPRCNNNLNKKDKTICSQCIERDKKFNTKESDRDLI